MNKRIMIMASVCALLVSVTRITTADAMRDRDERTYTRMRGEKRPRRPLMLQIGKETTNSEVTDFKSAVLSRIDETIKKVKGKRLKDAYPSVTIRLVVDDGSRGAPPPKDRRDGEARSFNSRPTERPDFPNGQSLDGMPPEGNPPEPPGGFERNGNDRPPEPPGGFRNRHSGGARRSDDPSDPSRYSGVETVDGTAKDYANREFVSEDQNKSPLYAKNGGRASVKNATFKSTARNANAILAIGKKSFVNVSNAVIITTGDSSRGLYAFQGGEIVATDVKISTRGRHCAAMATDRGRGKVMVCKGVLNTAGDGSPCIYATGELMASNVIGEAKDSEAMVIEGRNSIVLENAQLTGCQKCGAMIYQSFSGDAETGIGHLTMTDSTLKTLTGPVFFVTNTRAKIDLMNCRLVNRDKGPLVKIGPSRWGQTGRNGGTLTLTARNQKLEGDIEVSATSEFTLILEAGSSYRGAINRDGNGKLVKVIVKRGAKLDMTKDSIATVIK